MKSTTIAFWKLAAQQCNMLPNDSDDVLYLDENLRNVYITNCDNAYDTCKSNDMSEDVSNLDRHKIAAILVSEGLKLDIVKHTKGSQPHDDNKLFIGKEKLLLACAIHYLSKQINAAISENDNGLQGMRMFTLPTAFSCKTPYIDILSRLIHYSQQNGTLSPLELADRFFLLEYIAIREYYGTNADVVLDILRRSVTG